MRSFTLATVTALLFGTESVLAQGDIFVISCNPLTTYRADPIVSPGIASSHVHTVVGGTAFNRSMTQTQAVNSLNTTCNAALDNSNYWQPQLYHIRSDGNFELVQMSGIAAYYLKRTCDYDGTTNPCSDSSFYPAAPPAGLRMVSGDPTLRTFNASSQAQQAISHTCLTNGASQETNSLPTQQCLRIRAQVTMPSCWDGVNLDSSDHKSHVNFPVQNYNGGRCPKSHPKAIMQIFQEFFYETQSYTDRNFVYAMGDKTGYGLHGDFLNGWTDQTRLSNAHKTCTGPNGRQDPNCSINVGFQSAVTRKPQTPAVYEEEIGLNGPISKLPGNNPVTGNTPSKRSRVYGASDFMV